MTLTPTPTAEINIRPFQPRDLDQIEQLCQMHMQAEQGEDLAEELQRWQTVNRWYGVLKVLSMFPNPLRHLFSAYVAEQGDRIGGVIQVAPFNCTRSTWRVEQVLVNQNTLLQGDQPLSMDVGSLLLRHCFQSIWEARTWLLEVNVNDKDTLALYRHNGFQPLAHITYWTITPELLKGLAEREPDLPNLLPISNADACLLHQLDTASMPPLVRQVFDRNILDFKKNLMDGVIESISHRIHKTEPISGYVFESQRKAAIGYFKVQASKTGDRPNTAELTVHPAYTWLYPELMAQMARVIQPFPAQSLQLASSDYQPEREEYLERIGATRTEHTLLMSRSVWHKLRETNLVSLEGLQLSDVLQGFQPARKPVPGRFSFADSIQGFPSLSSKPQQPHSPSSYSNSDTSATQPNSENGRSTPEGDRLN